MTAWGGEENGDELLPVRQLQAREEPVFAAAAPGLEDRSGRLSGALMEALVSPFVAANVAEWDESAVEETSTASAVLKRGSSGDAVGRLQTRLTASGFPLQVDGNFGAGTEAAVKAFQTRVGLAADGIVGAQTWARLVAGGSGVAAPAASAAASSGSTGSGSSAAVPNVPLGTLVVRGGGRNFTYRFTPSDLLWTAKLLVHETGGNDDADSAAVLSAMLNRYGLFAHTSYPTFSGFVRAYSTTLQPVLINWRAAQRSMNKPGYRRTGGFYAKNPSIPKGQLQKHLDIQAAPWGSVKPAARALALRALTGRLANPGIGLASEFASTRVYYRQNHGGAEPTLAQWRQYTIDTAALKKWRWVGDVAGIDQRKNAFFLDLRAKDLPADAVKVLPPGASASELERRTEEDLEYDTGFDDAGEDELEEPAFEEPELEGRELEELGSEDEDDESSYEQTDEAVERFAFEQEWFADTRRWIASTMEKAVVAAELVAGKRDLNGLTNKVFFLRHPDRRNSKLGKDDDALKREWLAIRDTFVQPILLSGPRIGPIHGGPAVQKSLPPTAVISPLSVSVRGLRASPAARTGALGAIVVHTTGGGPASRSIKSGYSKPAVEYALDHYLTGKEGYAHYVIDFNGTIYATASENRQAAHTTWRGAGGRAYFKTWKAPDWWTRVWTPLGARSPIDLLSAGAKYPNQRTVGVELVMLPGYGYTDEQYRSLARLIVDVSRRQGLAISAAPSISLLGHEDFCPYPYKGLGGRENAGGGWDPGAHRDKPYFDWRRVWTEIQGVAPGFGTATKELENELFEAESNGLWAYEDDESTDSETSDDEDPGFAGFQEIARADFETAASPVSSFGAQAVSLPLAEATHAAAVFPGGQSEASTPQGDVNLTLTNRESSPFHLTLLLWGWAPLLHLPNSPYQSWPPAWFNRPRAKIASLSGDQAPSTKPYWPLQLIEDGRGYDANMDDFTITVTKLPQLNGAELSPEALIEKVRLNINDFIDTDYATFEPLDPVEADLWQTNHPLGAIVKIDAIGPDNFAVMCVDHWAGDKRGGWVFATMETGFRLVGRHPLCGVRSFGINEIEGGWEVRTRAIDRWDSALETVAGHMVGAPAQQALWESLQRGVARFVRDHGGTAVINRPIMRAVQWERIAQSFKRSSNPISF
jgi:N-acetyl-anhydromuramyl-L-alanine amidase AmpD